MVLALSFGRFYSIDSFVEFLIIIVSIIISYYSHRVYKLINDKNYQFFSFAFLSIAISFVFKILSNLTILNKITLENANFIFVIWHQLEYMQLINFWSFIFYKTFHLIGFLILFFIVTRTKNKEKIFLFIYFCIVAIFLSIYFNFIFHLTTVFILFSLTFHFYENHKKINSTNSLLVFIAFLIMLISHFFFVFSDMSPLFYLTGEILLLIGFLSLLVNQIKLKKENRRRNINHEKTNKIRSVKRSIRSTAKK